MAERIGILSLGDFSKILMLTPMFARIKRIEPGSSILLVCDGSITEHKVLLPQIDGFLSVDEAMERDFDLFINTDPDDLSCAVSSRVKTWSFKGFVSDEYGHKKVEGLWFKYMERMKEKSFLNMLHYSDVISTAAGFPVKEMTYIDFMNTVTTEQELFSCGPYGNGKKVNVNGSEWVSGFDRDGFLEYLPAVPVKMTQELFYGFMYRSVWKSTISRNIKAGDPQRFLSFGETFLDRMVDIDREVEQLKSKVLKRFTDDSVKAILSSQDNFLDTVTMVKELAFEGQKAAKDLLSAASQNLHDMTEVKRIRTSIQDIENKIAGTRAMSRYIAPLIDLFRTEEPVDDVKNLFPLAKSTMLSFEDLFSRASFTEEIIKGEING
jgi:hypothetical protein